MKDRVPAPDATAAIPWRRLRLKQDRVDQVIARLNQFNYLGALLGSVLTGVVGAGDLRLGFAVPMVLVLGLIPLDSQFAVVRRGTLRMGRSPGRG